MKYVFYSAYYVRLRLGVSIGSHRTVNPLGVQWRWRYWQSQQRLHCSRLF